MKGRLKLFHGYDLINIWQNVMKMLITMLGLNSGYLNLGQKAITDGTEIYAELLHSYIHLLMNILASDSQIKHIEIITAALYTKKNQ